MTPLQEKNLVPTIFLKFKMYMAILLFYIYIQYTVYDPKYGQSDPTTNNSSSMLHYWGVALISNLVCRNPHPTNSRMD